MAPFLAVAIACGGDDSSPTTDGGGGGDSPVTPACTDPTATGTARFFVTNFLDIPGEMPAGTVAGFNLDGITTPAMEATDPVAFAAGCGQPDRMSPAPDGEMGVDNQLSPILATLGSSLDIAGTIAENIRDGDLLILMEVVGIDETTNDDCVGVNIYLGKRQLATPAVTCTDASMCAVPTCATGMATGICESDACENSPCVDAMEVILPGQTFDVNTMSFTAGGAPLISVNGSIVNGRVRAGPVDITVPIPVGDMPLNLMIQQAQVRMSFNGDNIDTGVIGGKLDVEQIITTVNTIPDLMEFATIVETTLRNQADLDPDAEGMCQSVSVGLIFEGVPAMQGVTR